VSLEQTSIDRDGVVALGRVLVDFVSLERSITESPDLRWSSHVGGAARLLVRPNDRGNGWPGADPSVNRSGEQNQYSFDSWRGQYKERPSEDVDPAGPIDDQ
jgi:hypothetical protein